MIIPVTIAKFFGAAKKNPAIKKSPNNPSTMGSRLSKISAKEITVVQVLEGVGLVRTNVFILEKLWFRISKF